jgi:hypothetical protein
MKQYEGGGLKSSKSSGNMKVAKEYWICSVSASRTESSHPHFGSLLEAFAEQGW